LKPFVLVFGLVLVSLAVVLKDAGFAALLAPAFFAVVLADA
jgi:hypothetical protein